MWAGVETCDDGNLESSDGCEPNCEPTQILQMEHANLTGCALLTDRSLRCWGSGEYGKLLSGDTLHHGDVWGEMPARVVDPGGPVVQFGVSGHICALLDNNQVRCWGKNDVGQLGQPTDNVGDEPGEEALVVDVGPGTIQQISVGGSHSCILTDTGVVRCWGSNSYGKLGYGDTNHRGDAPGEMPPPDVAIGGTGAFISAGENSTCVVLDSGQVRCWGLNSVGQLGQGHTNNLGDGPGEMPPPLVDFGDGMASIVRAGTTTCVVLADGKVRCWGYNGTYQLGYNYPGNRGDAPNEMPPGNINYDSVNGIEVVDVSVGQSVCVLTNFRIVYCWGNGQYGQLGVGSTDNLPIFINGVSRPELELGADAIQLNDAGDSHCVVTSDHRIRCWGRGTNGALGIGGTGHIGDFPNEMPPQNTRAY